MNSQTLNQLRHSSAQSASLLRLFPCAYIFVACLALGLGRVSEKILKLDVRAGAQLEFGLSPFQAHAWYPHSRSRSLACP